MADIAKRRAEMILNGRNPDELDEFNTPVDARIQLPLQQPSSVTPVAYNSAPLPNQTDDLLSSVKGAAKPAAIPVAAKPKPSSIEDIQVALEKDKEVVKKTETKSLEDQTKSDFDVLKGNVPKPVERNLDWLEAQYNKLDKEYKDKKDSTEWRAIVETISNSLTKLFAAREGLRAGVDMSGLQLSTSDFNKELAATQEDIARRRGQAENLFSQSEKEKAAVEAGKERQEAKAFEREKFEYQKVRDEEARKLEREDMARKKSIHELDLLARKEEKELKAQSAKKGTPLTATEIESLGGFSGAVAVLKDLEEAKSLDNIDTGRIANIQNYLAQQVGIDDEKVTVFKKNLADVLASKVKAISGAAASDKEREFLKFTLPSFEQNDEQFLATLNNAISNMNKAKLERLKVYEQSGKDVSGFKQDIQNLETQQAAPKPSAAPYGNKVKQNGTTFVWDGSKYVPEVK